MNRRRVVTACAAGLAAAAGGVVWWLRQSPTGLDPAESALWAMRYEQPDGGTLAMESLRGRPVLLNFWATWCAPCIKEMPLLDRFHREHQASGWTVVGLAVDSVAPVREFLGRLPVAFPIGVAGMDGAELSRQLGNQRGALPFTVVFGRNGKAAARHLGAVDEALLLRWDKEVAKAA